MKNDLCWKMTIGAKNQPKLLSIAMIKMNLNTLGQKFIHKNKINVK